MAKVEGRSDEVTTDARRLLDAILPVAGNLSLPLVLQRIVESACTLADARYGALGVLGEDGALSDFVTVGMNPKAVTAVGDPPAGRGILGLLIVDPKPLRLRVLQEHEQSAGFPPNHPPMTSFLGVPIKIRDTVFGNLYLTDKQGADEFSEADEHLVLGLAAFAAVAIDNARLHAKVRELAVLEDRERIARDLHDTVIQRLFAAGMTLASVQRLAAEREVQERVHQVVDEVDATMRDIRSTIFALQASRSRGAGLRAEVLALVENATNTLGFTPSLTFHGLVDTLVSEGLADHLLAALREALTNVARHAHAEHVAVEVTAADGALRLTVRDDGRGIGQGRSGGYGLNNLSERAAALGGRFEARPVTPHGTVVDWSVPLSAPAHPA